MFSRGWRAARDPRIAAAAAFVFRENTPEMGEKMEK